MRRLRDDWLSGENRFSAAGDAFFVARDGEALAGFCGLNRDPFTEAAGVARLRRLTSFSWTDERPLGVNPRPHCSWGLRL